MRAQVVLTPPESKRLIGKAVVQMGTFRRAFNRGFIVFSTSTTGAFILEEALGSKIFDSISKYACGIVIPQGTCVTQTSHDHVHEYGHAPIWVIRDGQLVEMKLSHVLGHMSSRDVFVKAANALDPNKRAGVLLSARNGGTIGTAIGTLMARGVNLIIPVGLEKMISVSVELAASEAGIEKMNYSMGLPVGLMPLPGIVITEVEAIRILTKAEATPIAAGGIGGAEGSVVLVIKGSKTRVLETIKIMESIKGEKKIEAFPADCRICKFKCPGQRDRFVHA